ncbi:MAG: glycosyltransferase [Solirubrobacterales bacterium]|nr:glycosyltransferase [Solirubrobacterales bacterium]
MSGGRRRELELISRICEHFAVRLLVISKTAEQDQANAELLASSRCRIEVFPAVARHPGAPAGGAAHQVLRHRSPAGTMRIREIIAAERVDLVHVEGFYLMQHVPEWVEAPVLLVEQNIEYELDRHRAHSRGERVTRLDSFSDCVRTQAAELACWRRADRLAAVTWEDRELIREQMPDADVAVVPDGADHLPPRHGERSVGPIERPPAPRVTLLANFGYAPNVDAALHFCHEILPPIRAEVDDVHVWLVGNAPPPEVRTLAGERVTVTGYVPDVRPYLDAADVIVCPLRIGGGIKVKMIEAIRRGKAIVSTRIGAQGLPAQARRALLVAEDPTEFAHAVTTLLRDEPRRRLLERRAAAAAMKLPTWDESAAVLTKVYDELLDRSSRERNLEGSHLAGRSA